MNTVLTGATVALVSLILRRMGYSRAAQATLALIYGFSTLAFTYARYDYNKCLAAFLLALAFDFLLGLLHQPTHRNLLGCGFALGALAALRLELGPLALPFAFALARAEGGWRRSGKKLVLLFLPILAALAFIFFYNRLYWAGQVSGGYEGSFTWNPTTALSGFLFSPGKSVLLFNLPLLLMLFCLRPFAAKVSKVWLPWLAAMLYILLVYSFWGNWWGGWGFGPRHLVPLLPLAVLPLAEAFDHGTTPQRRTLFALAGMGCIVQLLGAAIDFSDVINVLMKNGFTELQLIWSPWLNPVWMHFQFLSYRPFALWDFAWIPFFSLYPLWIPLSLACLWLILLGVSGWAIFRFTRNPSSPS